MSIELPWAVIPAAGRGTRMRPATDVLPKVLLPVGLRPMIDWAFDEALAAPAAGIIVVVSPDQPEVARYVRERAGSAAWPDHVELRFIEQPRPAGLGDALYRCRAVTGEDAFGVVVPDNWFDAASPPIAQLAASHHRTGRCALGLVRVAPEEGRLLGNVGRVELEDLDGGDFLIRELGDKAAGAFSVDGGRPVLRGCARYVLTPEFYDALAATGPPDEGEWDDVPAFQHLIASRALVGGRLEGRLFDVGQPAGYLAAMSRIFERDVRGSDLSRSDLNGGGA